MSSSHVLCRFLSVFVCKIMRSCFPFGFGWYNFTLGVIMPTVYMAGNALVVARSQLQYVCFKERMVSSICQLLWIWGAIACYADFLFFCFSSWQWKVKSLNKARDLWHTLSTSTSPLDFQASHIAAHWLPTAKIRLFPGIIYVFFCFFLAEAVSHFDKLQRVKCWNLEWRWLPWQECCFGWGCADKTLERWLLQGGILPLTPWLFGQSINTPQQPYICC